MINERKIKLFVPTLFLSLFVSVSPVVSSEYEDLDSGMLLAQRSSNGNNNNKRVSHTESAAKSTSEKSTSEKTTSRPNNERPSRREALPAKHNDGPHVAKTRDDHHEPPRHHEPPHHHHGHGGSTVVVVEEPVVYTSSASSYSNEPSYTPSPSSSYYDIDRVMFFVKLGAGMSFRGVAGTPDDHEEYEEEEESDESFVGSLGYSVELRLDVGVVKGFFVSPGVSFARQSFCDEFIPGNYMISTKRFLDMPLFFGYRKATDPDFIGSISAGPRFVYGINGKCREYYDFFPAPDYGVFEHDSYGGELGQKRFSVGVGLEANLILDRFLVGINASFYPNSDCEPDRIYEDLYSHYRLCRKNFEVKVGWRIF